MKYILFGILSWAGLFFGGFYTAVYLDPGFGLLMVFVSLAVVALLGVVGGALFTRQTIFEAQKINDQYDMVKIKALTGFAGKIAVEANRNARNGLPAPEQVVDGTWDEVPGFNWDGNLLESGE